MLRTLRRRLILSHVLPLLAIAPLMGLALIYVIESRVLLPSLSNELKAQAVLIAQEAAEQPNLWQSSSNAQAFANRLAPSLTARLMLLDSAGRLLASSDATDAGQLGKNLAIPGFNQVAGSGAVERTTQSPHETGDVVDVLVPVFGAGQHLLGAVRLTHGLSNVYDLFARLRYLIAGVLAVGVLSGAALGWVLAVSLNGPLRQVTRAVSELAKGHQSAAIPKRGPEEIQVLSEAFNALAERLRVLEGTRRQLLANLVHEIGRPMGALLSATQALRQGAVDEPALRTELLAGMEEELIRLQRLLDNLAQLHDRVLGAPELVRRSVSLSDWLPRTLAPWQQTAQRKDLHWKAVLPEEMPEAEIDPDRMAQVLGNLLSNAIKYTPPGGSLLVEAGVDDPEVWIKVGDTGPGIAAEDQPRVFTPFYRGPREERFPQGMGLGLAIARDLAVAHGGRLELESAPGKGSNFTLRFPLRPR